MASDEKMAKLKNDAIKTINDIIGNCRDNKPNEISEHCNDLTRILFTYPNLPSLDIDSYCESKDILSVLIGSLENLAIQTKRNVLRLIHILLQSSKVLCDKARQSDYFQTFLRKHLELEECWVYRTKYKHQINIASLLLVGSNCSFNTALVRRTVLNSICEIATNKTKEGEDALPCIVFYACSMFTTTFEDIPTNVDNEPASEKIMSKFVTGQVMDILRDYIQSYKLLFSEETNSDRDQSLLYRPKSEYSLPQIFKAIIYYSVKSAQLRENLYECDLYGMMNNLFSLKGLPEPLLQWGIDILKLPALDPLILQKAKDGSLRSINEKLDRHCKRNIISEQGKAAIQEALRVYKIPAIQEVLRVYNIPANTTGELGSGQSSEHHQNTNDDQPLIHLTNIVGESPYVSLTYDQFGRQDVSEWLADNELGDLREVLSHLTGRGLKQLKGLIDEHPKMEVIDFLIRKMGIEFDVTLELIGALEKL